MSSLFISLCACRLAACLYLNLSLSLYVNCPISLSILSIFLSVCLASPFLFLFCLIGGGSGYGNEGGTGALGFCGGKASTYLNVLSVFFLWLRCLGFLRGTGIKMATFVLMLQACSS
jgi:hypothetical protein